MASTYTPIATTTLGSAANSVSFTGIDQSYTDLILVADAATNIAVACYIQLGNGSIDTGTNYSMTYLYGNGSAASSGRESNATKIFVLDCSTSQSNTIIHLQNYKNASVYKTVISRGNAAAVAASAQVGLWRSTSAINQIKLFADSARTFNAGSTFTLYGIKAA